MWRGSLLPLECEALPPAFFQAYRVFRVYDDFVAEREQAPSPQKQTAELNGIRQKYHGF